MSVICWPVLETDTIKYSVQPGLGFLADGYWKARGMAHTGCDLNATTGGDTDLGNNVRAVADGVIVEAGQNYRGWGGIVLIHHPHLGVWTQYAHLQPVRVKTGDVVRMGDVIGNIGKGDRGQFLAHLHFEVRRALLPAAEWPSSTIKDRGACEAWISARYLDPEKWLNDRGAMRTLAEVQAARAPQPAPVVVPALPPQSAGARVLLSLPGQPFEDVTGARVTVERPQKVVVNATKEGETWISVQ